MKINLPVPARLWRVSPGRLALAGLFVGLLLAAAALRFYDLPGHYLWGDEVTAADHSSGALAEVIPNTRSNNSSPILYPLALWAVQKVESTPFSVRLLPATASILTVAALLFLLPRLGVNRWAAFLAALLTTLSVAAIRHAQDAREYSIDALLAVLLLAGLLWYLRDGRKSLLCVALFVAPLLQYGLVLFGVAVLGAAILLTPPTGAASAGNSTLNRVSSWLKARVALVGPAACFLAGGVLSYAVTLRYQWQAGGFGSDGYLAAYYYQGGLDAPAIFEFSINGIWKLLTYHLPEAVAIAALPGFAFLLVATCRGKFPDRAIGVLFALCLAIAVAVALLSLYPLDRLRHVIYLGPLVFLAVGLAFQGAAGYLAGLTRRGWLAPALVGAVAGAIALAGVVELRRAEVYAPADQGREIVAVLQERAQKEDVVYLSVPNMPYTMRFHQITRTGKVIVDGEANCQFAPELCFQEIIAAISPTAGKGKLWLVSHHPLDYRGNPGLRMLQMLDAYLSLEPVVSEGKPYLYLIEDTESLTEIAAATDMLRNIEPILPGKPALRSGFDVYLSENALTYVKEPCAPADTEAMFFLALYPVDVNDLPGPRQQHGFDNQDFDFDRQGWSFDGRCMAAIALPEYGISRISTGQYTPVWGGYKHLWEGEFSGKEGE